MPVSAGSDPFVYGADARRAGDRQRRMHRGVAGSAVGQPFDEWRRKFVNANWPRVHRRWCSPSTRADRYVSAGVACCAGEPAIARAAIDAGMDVVLGRHHHEIRGVEFYRDKPIFHGLGLFAFDLHGLLDRATPGMIEAWRKKYGEYGMWPREGWPLLPMHPMPA